MTFLSDVPIWEQLKRAGERKKVGRKHNKTTGPGKAKMQARYSEKRAAAWRKFKEQMGLYMTGKRDTIPKKPIIER